MQKKPNGLS